MKSLLTLLFSLFLYSSAEAMVCSVFAETWPEGISYERAKENYELLGVEKGFEVLGQRVQEGPLRIEEVIGFLDANVKGKEKLYDKIKLYSEPSAIYNNAIFRYLTAPVKVKGEAFRIQRSQLRSEKEVRDFVTHLLESVQKVELNLLRSRLLQSFPKSKEQIEELVKADAFFYRNMDVFGKFIELAPKDAMTENPWFGAFSRFFLNFSDPILNHRLNTKDFIEFQSGNLDASLKHRLLAPLIARQTRRAIFWGALIASVMMLPTNIAESNQAYVIAEKQLTYLSTNRSEVEQRLQDRYEKVFQRLLEERSIQDANALQEARQSKNSDQIQNIELQILELRSQSL